jgi:hypothetical protein
VNTIVPLYPKLPRFKRERKKERKKEERKKEERRKKERRKMEVASTSQKLNPGEDLPPFPCPFFF